MKVIGAWRQYLQFIKDLWVFHGSTQEFAKEFTKRSKQIQDILCSEKDFTPMQLEALGYGEPMGQKAEAMAEELVAWVSRSYRFQR